MVVNPHFFQMIPPWLFNPELHATVLLGFTCVGAYVIVSYLIQLIFSILWPFFAVLLVLMLMPHWRKVLTIDVLPKYAESVRTFAEKFIYNSTSS